MQLNYLQPQDEKGGLRRGASKGLLQGEFERGVSEESLILGQNLQIPEVTLAERYDDDQDSVEERSGSPPKRNSKQIWFKSAADSNDANTSSPQTETQTYEPSSKEELVRLNIGGILYVTTKTTLFSKGDNFFTPLLSGKISSLKDETGAYYIDRNGKNFEPILDFLRYGQLIVPKYLKIASVINEANFYAIDIVPGLCGNIKEGLYTSSHWILFLERDVHHPWIFGLTGIEDGFSKESKNVFFKQVCKVKQNAIHWKYKDIRYKIFVSDDKVFMWNPTKYDSYTQLYFRCPCSKKFPLDILQTLTAERTSKGDTLTISFKTNANREIFAKTSFSQASPSNTGIYFIIYYFNFFFFYYFFFTFFPFFNIFLIFKIFAKPFSHKHLIFIISFALFFE